MSINIKLSDGGSNVLSFMVDSFDGPKEITFDKISRTSNGSLKQYEVAQKLKWELKVNNITNDEYNYLKTLYELRTTLEFYEDADAAKTADVFWMPPFDFAPTGRHRYFRGTIWEGIIILEEV